MPDNDGLRATMDRVIDAAAMKQWNQGEWVKVPADPSDPLELAECGTVGCFAGHYAFAQGYTRLAYREIEQAGWRVPHWDWVLENPETGDRLLVDEDDCWGMDTVASFATTGLGLTRGQANALFSGGNTLEDLKHTVDLLCAGEKVRIPPQ